MGFRLSARVWIALVALLPSAPWATADERAPTPLTCLFPAEASGLVEGHFVRVGADLTAESGGEVQVRWEQARDGPRAAALRDGTVACALLPFDQAAAPAADLLTVPFTVPLSAEQASRGAWDALQAGWFGPVDRIAPVLLVVDSTLVVVRSADPPLTPDALVGGTVAVPNAEVAAGLAAFGAAPEVMPRGPATDALAEGKVSAALLPTASLPTKNVAEPFGVTELQSDRALAAQTYLLAVSTAHLANHWPQLTSRVTRDDLARRGRMRSAAAGRHLDLAAAVAAEEAAAAGRPFGRWDEAQMERLRAVIDANVAERAADPARRAGLTALRGFMEAAERQ